MIGMIRFGARGGVAEAILGDDGRWRSRGRRAYLRESSGEATSRMRRSGPTDAPNGVAFGPMSDESALMPRYTVRL